MFQFIFSDTLSVFVINFFGTVLPQFSNVGRHRLMTVACVQLLNQENTGAENSEFLWHLSSGGNGFLTSRNVLRQEMPRTLSLRVLCMEVLDDSL